MKFEKGYTNLLKYYDPKKIEIKEILNFCDFTNKIVLDIGCGEGKNSIAMATKAKYVYGIDPSGDLIEIANKVKKSKKLRNIEFKLGKAEKIIFPNNYFDIIVTTWALHHFDNLKKALGEIYRVLKKNGELFFLEPTDNSEWNKIELETSFKLNKKVNISLEEFWIKILTFLNKQNFKWKVKLFEPLYVFPNVDLAVKIFHERAESEIKNEPKAKNILKGILKRFEKKNGSIEFHDQAFMILAKR